MPTGEVTPVTYKRSAPARERVEMALARAAEPAAQNVFIGLDQDDVCRRAYLCDQRKTAARPLEGWLIAIKDNIDEAGRVTTAGVGWRSGTAPAAEDAGIVRRIVDQGAIPFGRTVLSEFAFSGLGLNAQFGTPRNASDPARPRLPGGSSSGSAVAVALGIVPAALATDTSGSARVPAALNGVAGFRPSHGRYPHTGLFPLAPSLDTPGILARDVETCAVLDRVIARGAVSASGTELRTCIVPDLPPASRPDEDVAQAFAWALGRLDAAGVRIAHRRLASFDHVTETIARCGTWVTAEASDHLGLLIAGHLDQIDPLVQQRLAIGAAQTAEDRRRLKRARARARIMLSEELGADSLLFPTVPLTAPALKALPTDLDGLVALNARLLHNTMFANVLDMPALSIPIPEHSALPCGLQLSAANGRDRAVLRSGRFIEGILNAKDQTCPKTF